MASRKGSFCGVLLFVSCSGQGKQDHVVGVAPNRARGWQWPLPCRPAEGKGGFRAKAGGDIERGKQVETGQRGRCWGSVSDESGVATSDQGSGLLPSAGQGE